MARQGRIEAALARRHLQEGALVLYEVTSVALEGRCCPLARYGHPRDGHRGKRQIVFGLLCMLAYYVEWQMRQSLAPLLWGDEDPAAGEALRASAVAPARPKAQTQHSDDGWPVHNFQTLLAGLDMIAKDLRGRNFCDDHDPDRPPAAHLRSAPGTNGYSPTGGPL